MEAESARGVTQTGSGRQRRLGGHRSDSVESGAELQVTIEAEWQAAAAGRTPFGLR